MTDPNRATFVQQEYRTEVSQDLSIRAAYPTSAELVHNTNLSQADAAALAIRLHDENREPAEAYRVTVQGQYQVEEIASGPIRWTLEFPTYGISGQTFKTTKFEIDPFEDRTTFEVRK